jgi:MFS transporter, DHA1 family, inner membrane transport protein
MGEDGPGAEGAARVGWFTGAELVLLLVLAAVQFTHVLDFMIVLPLGPIFQEKMGLTPQQFGFLVAAYGFSAGASGLTAAWFLDRFDRKRILLFLYAGFTVGTVLCAVAPGFVTLVVARAVAGAFGGIAGANVLAIVGDAFAEERRGRAMGVVMSAFSCAQIAGLPAGLWLANLLGWRAPFAILGGLSGAVLLLAMWVLPPLRGHLAHGRPRPAGTWAVLCHPAHVRAYALMAVLVLSTSMIFPYLVDYLEFNVHRTHAEVPWVYVCGGLASLVTLNVIGKLADRFGKLPVFRVLAVCAVLPTLLVTNLPPVSLVAALAASTLFMVVTSGRMVPAMALITSCVVPRYRGSFLSLNASVQQFAMGLAALLAGAILGQAGESAPLTGFTTVGILGAAIMLVSVVLAGTLRPADEGPEAAIAVDAPGGPAPALIELPQEDDAA